jgi:outer membrane protein
MKNISLAINAILAALIVVLFIMINSLKHSASGDSTQSNSGSNAPATTLSKQKVLRIAYINDDTISLNYMVMKDLKKEMENRQAVLQNEYDVKSRKLQQEYDDYQKKAQSGNISQLDAQKAGEDLQNKKAELDGIQRQVNELLQEAQVKNQSVEIKVQDYIKQFNKTAKFDYVLAYSAIHGTVLLANDSLDITKQILGGLNQMYNDSIQKAKH